MSPPDIELLHLDQGSHRSRQDGMCAMEAVAYLAGEPHSDHPACVSPVLAKMVASLNDSLDDAQRQLLKPYLARLLDTAGSPELDGRRMFVGADHAIRSAAPAALRSARLEEQAATLESLPPLTDESAARSAASASAWAASAAQSAASASAARSAASASAWAASAAQSAASASAAQSAASAAQSAQWAASAWAAQSAASAARSTASAWAASAAQSAAQSAASYDWRALLDAVLAVA